MDIRFRGFFFRFDNFCFFVFEKKTKSDSMETWIWGSLISLSLVLFLVLWKVWYSPSNLAWRKNFALSAASPWYPTSRSSKKKNMGVFFLAKYGSFKEYLQKSDRIIRRNLTTALAKSFITHDVLAMTVSSRSFGWGTRSYYF